MTKHTQFKKVSKRMEDIAKAHNLYCLGDDTYTTLEFNSDLRIRVNIRLSSVVMSFPSHQFEHEANAAKFMRDFAFATYVLRQLKEIYKSTVNGVRNDI